MRMLLKAALSAGLIAMASACGGAGDDAAGDNVAEAADMKADNMEDMADNMSNGTAAEMMEDNASMVREAGEDKEEAIDEADVKTN